MTNQSATIVQRLWNYCNVLRDDGMAYGDYVEQLTYPLFLMMDDENARYLRKPSVIPADLNWESLLERDGDELEAHYRHILAELGRGSGLIPVIFRKAQNKIQEPAKLRRLIDPIGAWRYEIPFHKKTTLNQGIAQTAKIAVISELSVGLPCIQHYTLRYVLA